MHRLTGQMIATRFLTTAICVDLCFLRHLRSKLLLEQPLKIHFCHVFGKKLVKPDFYMIFFNNIDYFCPFKIDNQKIG